MANQLQKMETKKSSKQMLNDFLTARKKLENKLKSERVCLIAALDGKRSELKVVLLHEIIHVENRTKQLENEEKLTADSEHVCIITHKNEKPLTAQ